MKELVRLVCAVLFFVNIAGSSAWSQQGAHSPPRVPVLDQTALVDAGVEIFYDGSMIPHIFGETDEAAFYGLGYHHMLEFPIGTLNMLWVSSGRMAEIAGESYLDEDRLTRLWMESSTPSIHARHEAELIDSGLFDLIVAYVAGVEAGRAWWRADPARLEALIGDDAPADAMEHLEMWFDPVPDYLNPAWSPYGSIADLTYPDPVTDAMRRVVDRMFDASMPVTTDHVLHLGAAINSFFLLRNNSGTVGALSGPDAGSSFLGPVATPLSRLASNGWMISREAAGDPDGDALTLSDGHLGLNKLAIRPYIVQLEGLLYSATGLTMPGYPAVYVGFNDNISWLVTNVAGATVASNKWRVKLGKSQRLKFGLSGSASRSTALEKETDDYVVYDPVSDAVSSVTFDRFYVPVIEGDPDDGLGFTRYPIVAAEDPRPGDLIDFEQAAFTTESSPWEFFLLMGYATNATTDIDAILDTSSPTTRTRRVLFGNGMNLMVADSEGNLRYHFLSRVPWQGTAVTDSQFKASVILPGRNVNYRWRGFHPTSGASPIGVPNMVAGPGVTGSPLGSEVWINNNVTPDFVELGANGVYDGDDRFSAADLDALPAYMVGNRDLTNTPTNDPIATWRQKRADELLRGATPPLTATDSEGIACDQTDNWMRAMWPLFQIMRGDINQDGAIVFPELPSLLLTDADQTFMDWVEAHRHLDEMDMVDPTIDFMAHPFSEVTVYTTVLRSFYLSALQPLKDADLLTAEQFTLGEDPCHPVFATPLLFTIVGYGPNITAMATAIKRARRTWARGLENGTVLAGLFPPTMVTPPELSWEDSRFASGPRWGHVNTFALTPHHLLPVGRRIFGGLAATLVGEPPFSVTGQSAAAVVAQVYVNMAIDPIKFDPLAMAFPSAGVIKRFLIPFYHAQSTFALPIGGVKHSLYTVENKNLFGNLQPPNGYEQAVYVWEGPPSPSLYYYVPMSAGSQSMMSVSIGPSGATAYFLLAIGGTEITTTGLVPELDYQVRFGPSPEFVRCTWLELVRTMPAGTPDWDLRYVDPTP